MKQNYVVMNINTGVNPVAELFLPEFDESTVKVGNLTDPVKIESKKRQSYMIHKNTFLNDCALNPETGCVLVSSYLEQNEQEVWVGKHDRVNNAGYDTTEEIRLIENFWDKVESCYIRDTKVVTLGGRFFDFSFITRRSFLLGVRPLDIFIDGRLPDWIIDVKDLWFLGTPGWETRGKRWSMDFFSTCFTLPAKPFEGKNFHKFFANNLEKAMEYCEHELQVIHEIYRRLNRLRPPKTSLVL